MMPACRTSKGKVSGTHKAKSCKLPVHQDLDSQSPMHDHTQLKEDGMT